MRLLVPLVGMLNKSDSNEEIWLFLKWLTYYTRNHGTSTGS
jgi:hypothetical protein